MLCIIFRYGAAVVKVAGEAQQRGTNGEARKQIVWRGSRVGSVQWRGRAVWQRWGGVVAGELRRGAAMGPGGGGSVR